MDLLGWLTGCGPGSWAIAVSHWRGQPVLLDVPGVPFWRGRSGGFLQSFCSSVYFRSWENLVLSLKECYSNRVEELSGASKPEAVPVVHILLSGAIRKCPPLEWLFLLQIIWPWKLRTAMPSSLCPGSFQLRWQPRVAVTAHLLSTRTHSQPYTILNFQVKTITRS